MAAEGRYENGILRELWDNETRLRHLYDEDGFELPAPASPVPFNANENENADRVAQAAADQERAAMLRQQLAEGVAAILAARDAADADRAQADILKTQADSLSAAIQARIAAVAAFVPGATYRQSDLVAVRDELVTLLNRQKQITDAMAGMYAYRRAVDANAVTTDNALLWLARLVSGEIL